MRPHPVLFLFSVSVLVIASFSVPRRGTSQVAYAARRSSTLDPSSRIQVRTPIQNWLRGWPMVGHDPQRTNHSPLIGPAHPQLLWTRRGIADQPIVATNDTIYAWSGAGLTAFSRDGRFLWHVPGEEGDGGPPALTPQMTVGVLALPRKVIDPTRTKILTVGTDGRATVRARGVGFSKTGAPLATPYGTLIIPIVGPRLVGRVYGGLESVSPSGRTQIFLNHLSIDDVAEAPSGRLYVIVTDLTGATELDSLAQSGAMQWQYGSIAGPLMAGVRGTVYASMGNALVALDIVGRVHVEWRRRLASALTALAADRAGVILSVDGQWLNAWGSGGDRLWRLSIGTQSQFGNPAIAVDRAGRVYVASPNGTLLIVSPSGHVEARLSIGPRHGGIAPHIAIAPGHRLVVVGTDGMLRVYGPRNRS
ncbi:MAG TPA: hypothetical protein VFA78_07755 [Chloroflexota bacterium]|nr:hypothetical protein [Chloroflexota bacterium]